MDKTAPTWSICSIVILITVEEIKENSHDIYI